ncbi:hypothetical protein [Proteiniphilum propionicum]|uniref:hypothetical protein n=1 Tax=Proteiniphilum propionicum TaxID=2829812 RepID=UPI001EEB9F05|nr:hypothetical protein [Proteiniphilum propionicum]ULB34343.1 hypothetical protein KDN43_15525 [Proteiniphilum propionicum]
MKTIPLRLITATALIIGTVFAVSVIAAQETVAFAMIFATFAVMKFIIRATIYIVFKMLKWGVIIAVIGVIGLILTMII